MNRPHVVVPLLRSGVLAREFCRRGGPANVEAVFERSVYLRSGAEFICVGEPSVGNGPLTLIGPTGFLSGLGLDPNQPACVSDRHIDVGDRVRLTLDTCEPWRPSRSPVCPQPMRLIGICDALTRRAAAVTPEEGLARVVFGAPESNPPSLARIARPGITAFIGALSGVLGDEQAAAIDLEKSVQGLIGLGPGLTPSGDDFLLGVLALLDALGEVRAHAALARMIVERAPELTAPLSCCFLRAAAAGHIGETLHCAVASILAGEVDPAISLVAGIGHSSGWDMLAGIATTLRILAAARLSVQPPHVN